MSKAKKTGKAAGIAVTKKLIEGRQVVAPAAGTISVLKRDKQYVGARAKWYVALLAHDTQPADAFVSACTKKPPATPKSGKAEDPRGWLRYFVRERVAKVA